MAPPPRKSSLSIESLARGHISYVRLYGTIDETFDPTVLLEAAVGRDLLLNLKAVSRISSFGVRDWVHTLEALRQRTDRIVLVECSPAVVAQMNMVANFALGATIASVQAPYFCEKCGWDTEVLVNLAGGEAGPQPPDTTCKRCGRPMALDDDPESYFAFRKGLPAQVVDPGLQEFLVRFANAGSAEPDQPPVATAFRGRVQRSLTSVSDRLRRAWVFFASRMNSRRRLAVGIGVASALLLAVGLVLISRPSGIPQHQLARFHQHLMAGQFIKAEELLAQFRRDRLLSRELQTLLSVQVTEARTLRAKLHTEAISAAAHAKRFDEVATLADRPVEGAPIDNNTLFLVAEAQRQLGRCTAALSTYGQFEAAAAKLDPADKRLDDAVFWQGDCALKLGRTEAARAAFRKIVSEYPRSDFRNSALARLKTMTKK